ncbi:S-layer homology domain-containing protein [Lacrimispora xylanisolvens]|uniref:S-layer homology domain-containing protein n=1 Tax=Lacrimispora xylanisolvens TaxID=384636 RepID=UPI0024028769
MKVLAKALGKLADIDPNAYSKDGMADSDSPYIQWAKEKGIIVNRENSQVLPDQPLFREEAAAILANYAKATEYKLPQVRSAVVFTDAAKIQSGYQESVAAMQKAGVILSKEGSSFSPKANASRAEIAAMLHRYIKLTIDPSTAEKWAKNDSGQYLFYREGKAVTDWQTINDVTYFFDGNGILVSGRWIEIQGKWYYFNTDGSLARSTKVDDYEVDEKGVRK